jgi:hypothetical protein
MRDLWQRLRTWLAFPTRVSRLYPVFSLILFLLSGVLFYSWQKAEINYETLADTVAYREANLRAQVTALTQDRDKNQLLLSQQQAKIADATSSLQKLQAEYQSVQTQFAAAQAQLKAAKDQVKQQEAQLATNAAELEQLRKRPPLFSFQNQSSLADINSKEADVKALITNAYDYIVSIYGQPYLINSITITFVDSFSISSSSGEIIIENSNKGINIDIHLKDFDKTNFQDVNTVIHEIIHAFHGVAVFESSALEEGITVAATDAVMSKMMADGKITHFSHLYLTIDANTYTDWNKTLSVYADNDKFYADSNVSKVYQLIGTAWYKMYTQDNAFFKNLNANYYPLVQRGQTPNTTLIKNSIKAVLSQVANVPISTYLSDNKAFNPQ